MVKQVDYRGRFTRSYSTRNRKIKQIKTGDLYDEAIDLKEYPMEYEETEEYTDEYKMKQKLKSEELNTYGDY